MQAIHGNDSFFFFFFGRRARLSFHCCLKWLTDPGVDECLFCSPAWAGLLCCCCCCHCFWHCGWCSGWLWCWCDLLYLFQSGWTSWIPGMMLLVAVWAFCCSLLPFLVFAYADSCFMSSTAECTSVTLCALWLPYRWHL